MQATGPLVEQPLVYFQQVLDTNLTGAVRVTQAVVPAMLARVGLILHARCVSASFWHWHWHCTAHEYYCCRSTYTGPGPCATRTSFSSYTPTSAVYPRDMERMPISIYWADTGDCSCRAAAWWSTSAACPPMWTYPCLRPTALPRLPCCRSPTASGWRCSPWGWTC